MRCDITLGHVTVLKAFLISQKTNTVKLNCFVYSVYRGIITVCGGPMFVDFVGHPSPTNLHPHEYALKSLKIYMNIALIALCMKYPPNKVPTYQQNIGYL
jgi:hypothetical protein